MKVVNSEGESLQDRMDATGVKTYQGTVVSSYPNFFWFLGPNTATNHSSVLFTTEAQIALTFHMIRPVLARLSGQRGRIELIKPAPYVEVRREAEDRYYAELRKRMKGMVWENKGGVAWYVDKATGLCTVSPSSFPPRGPVRRSASPSLMSTPQTAGAVPLDAVPFLAALHVPELWRLQVDQLQRSVEVAELPRLVVILPQGNPPLAVALCTYILPSPGLQIYTSVPLLRALPSGSLAARAVVERGDLAHAWLVVSMDACSGLPRNSKLKRLPTRG